MTTRSDEFGRRFDGIVRAQEDFIDGEGKNQRSKWEQLFGLLQSEIQVAPAAAAHLGKRDRETHRGRSR